MTETIPKPNEVKIKARAVPPPPKPGVTADAAYRKALAAARKR